VGPAGPAGSSPTVLFAEQTSGATSELAGGAVPGATVTLTAPADNTIVDVSVSGGFTATPVGPATKATCSITLVVDGTSFEGGRVSLIGSAPYGSVAFQKRLTLASGVHTLSLQLGVVAGINNCAAQNEEWAKFHLYATVR
jgi:hypothetical protein